MPGASIYLLGSFHLCKGNCKTYLDVNTILLLLLLMTRSKLSEKCVQKGWKQACWARGCSSRYVCAVRAAGIYWYDCRPRECERGWPRGGKKLQALVWRAALETDQSCRGWEFQWAGFVQPRNKTLWRSLWVWLSADVKSYLSRHRSCTRLRISLEYEGKNGTRTSCSITRFLTRWYGASTKSSVTWE